MPFLKLIEDQDASGPIGEIYAQWRASNPGRDNFPDILKCFGAAGNADVLQGLLALSYSLQFSDGILGRRRKEMIAAYVSALNQCPY